MESKNKNSRNDVLKLIAVITMLIDHIGYFFYPEITLFRIIGRISFPIFAYYIAMGFGWTSNKKIYAFRVFLFALISQSPYVVFSYLASGNSDYNPIKLNVMFLLFTGIIMLYLYENSFFFTEKLNLKSFLYCFAFFFVVMVPSVLRFYLRDISIIGLEGKYNFYFSYETYGLILIFIFYRFKDDFVKVLLSFIVLSSVDIIISSFLPYTGPEQRIFQSLAIMGIIVIYTIKDINFAFRMPKWFAYWFYPVHLGILGLIDYFNIL